MGRTMKIVALDCNTVVDSPSIVNTDTGVIDHHDETDLDITLTIMSGNKTIATQQKIIYKESDIYNETIIGDYRITYNNTASAQTDWFVSDVVEKSRHGI